MKSRFAIAAAAVLAGSAGHAGPVLAPPPALGPDVQPFVHVPAGKIAITHLRIIDGTGAAPVEDATLLIDGREDRRRCCRRVAPVPAGYRMIDGSGRDGAARPRRHAQPPVLPAAAEHRCVGPFRAADHRPADDFQRAAPLSRQRRDDDAHDRQRRALHRPQPQAGDRRRAPGRPAPRRDRPLSRRARRFFIQIHQLTSPDDARQEVAFWADQGATSFKAYMNITRAELERRDRRGAPART